MSPRSMRLSFGNFYGSLKTRADVAGIGLAETVYPAHAQLPQHTHESAYFCLVLKGSYQETVARRQRVCRTSMLVFHPAGEAHSDRFGEEGGACFNLEFGPTWMERVRVIAKTLDAPTVFVDPATTRLAARIQHELRVMDNVSALAIESLALEIVVNSARRCNVKASPTGPPPWLKQSEELIRVHIDAPLTLAELASAINRHPVHLAREFRRYYGCTIGDHIRRLRLEIACRRLSTSDEPVAMIALACGFSSQSHFSTFFRQATGFTPGNYRATFRTALIPRK